MSNPKINQMDEFKFMGKSIEEFEKELEHANGLDENGDPKWWQAQSNLIDATVFRKLLEMGKINQNGRQ